MRVKEINKIPFMQRSDVSSTPIYRLIDNGYSKLAVPKKPKLQVDKGYLNTF